MLQIIATLAIFLILVIPMGKYMYHIATYQKTFADKVFNPIDHFIYKICGIKDEEMGWKKYALTLVMVNAVMVFVGYLILRIQNVLFLNPNGIEGMDASLSFNTIISFMTNTNLQHYAGESGLSYASQMCVIIFMMFTSAASGYAACMAFCRGLSGRKMGNFYKENHNKNFDSGITDLGIGVSQPGSSTDTDGKCDGKHHRRKVSGFGNGTCGGAGIHQTSGNKRWGILWCKLNDAF